MKSPAESNVPRRTVLKTAGLFGLAAGVGMTGTAAAKKGDLKKQRDVEAFLNHPAAYKDGPIWDGTVEDMTGMAEVMVVTGAMTSVNIPEEPIPMAPVAFAPQAIEVDAGTEVVWTWAEYDPPVPPVPHDVVARKIVKGEPLFASELQYPAEAEDFSYIFEEPGEYLYYCTPHGAPFAVESFLGEMVNNEFGMRGAVIVRDA